MTDRERLIELLSNCQHEYDKEFVSAIAEQRPVKSENAFYADHLLRSGVIVAPMPMANWLKEELTEYVRKRCFEEL